MGHHFLATELEKDSEGEGKEKERDITVPRKEYFERKNNPIKNLMIS